MATRNTRRTLLVGAALATMLSCTGFVMTGCTDVETHTDKQSGSSYYTDSGTTTTKGAEIGAKTAPATHYTFYQELPGGGRVLCVTTAESGGSGGISCDWEHVAGR